MDFIINYVVYWIREGIFLFGYRNEGVIVIEYDILDGIQIVSFVLVLLWGVSISVGI